MTNQRVKIFIIISTAVFVIGVGIWVLLEIGVFEPTKTTQKILGINIDAPSEVVKFNYDYEKSDNTKSYSYLQIAHEYLWEITFHVNTSSGYTHAHIKDRLDNKLYIAVYNYKYSNDTPTLIDLSLFYSAMYVEATARKINRHEK